MLCPDMVSLKVEPGRRIDTPSPANEKVVRVMGRCNDCLRGDGGFEFGLMLGCTGFRPGMYWQSRSGQLGLGLVHVMLMGNEAPLLAVQCVLISNQVW